MQGSRIEGRADDRAAAAGPLAEVPDRPTTMTSRKKRRAGPGDGPLGLIPPTAMGGAEWKWLIVGEAPAAIRDGLSCVPMCASKVGVRRFWCCAQSTFQGGESAGSTKGKWGRIFAQ